MSPLACKPANESGSPDFSALGSRRPNVERNPTVASMTTGCELYPIHSGSRFGGGVWSNLFAADPTISRHGFIEVKFAPKILGGELSSGAVTLFEMKTRRSSSMQ